MKKKLLAFLLTAALAAGLCPAAAFAAPANGDGLMAAQVETPLNAAAVADPTCMLVDKAGNLWQCTSAGAPVSMVWERSSAFYDQKNIVKKVFVAADVATYNREAKYSYKNYSGNVSSTTQYLNSTFSKATELHFLTGANGLSACRTLPADAFSGWSNLQAIVNFDKTQVASLAKNQFSYTALKSIALPKTCKTISTYAFSSCTSLTSVDASKSQVTSIGTYAFSRCTALKTVSLPATLKTLNNYAFNGCSKLTAVKNLNKTRITTVKKGAFYGCAALKSVTLPNTCKTIGEDAFWDCKKLSKITLGSKTTTVGAWAFRNCKSLKSIVLPATCKKVGSFAFSNCTSLKKVTMKSKSVVRNAKKASYYMDDIFFKTPIAKKKGGTARIYVPKSVLSKYKSKSYSNKWHYISPSRFRGI